MFLLPNSQVPVGGITGNADGSLPGPNGPSAPVVQIVNKKIIFTESTIFL